MKVLLIDDEQDSHDVLHHHLNSNHPEINILGNAFSIQEGLSLIGTYQPELVFLDIQLPDGTGFDLLQHFKSPSFQVVFITAFNQFAQTAIRFGALDYLTKPVDPLELKAALLKAQVKQLEIQVAQLEIMRDTLSKVVEKKLPLRMSISTNKGVLYFDPANIIRLEAMQNFTEIKVEHDNRRLIASLIIRRFEEDLKPYRQFMRVQRSHMVNLHKVVRLARGDQFGLEMIDGKLVPIGKRYREDVVRRLEEYQV